MTRAIVVCAILLSGSPALAFHEVSSFSRSANSGGGSTYFFTGSPRFKGYDCAICHTGAAGRISVELTTDPPELADGRFEPGTIYRLDVEMLGEHRGLESAFNPNTFALEVIDDRGAEVGSLFVQANTIMRLADDGRVALAEGAGNGETEWTLHWLAPDAPIPATLHLGALDGDGASDPERRWIDAPNDDVAIVALRLCPVGAECPAVRGADESPSAVQCSTTHASGGLAPWMLLAIAVALPLGLRRRPRGRRRIR